MAFDMTGHWGFGVGATNSLTPDHFIMKWGYSSKLVFEPHVKLAYTNYNDFQSKYFGLGWLVNYTISGREKSNVYLISGVSYTNETVKDSETETISTFDIPLGIGFDYKLGEYWLVTLSSVYAIKFPSNGSASVVLSNDDMIKLGLVWLH